MASTGDFATIGIEIKQTGAKQAEAEVKSLQQSITTLTGAIQQNTAAQTGHTTSQTKQTATTKAATKAIDEKNQALTRSSGRLKVIGRDINRYFLLPMAAMIAVTSRAAYTLNEGLGNVQALIPDTGDRIYELRDAVRELGAETGVSFREISDGLYRTISVFQDNADTVERLNTAIRVGVAGYATTAESVQLLSSVTRAYGDTSAEAVDRVADLAFETVRLGDTTIPALASAMQVATDRAVRLNVSQEELFATMATLTGITGDASMVATQFRSAMDSLLNPTDDLTALMEDMGYASAEAAISQEGMIGLLVAINNAAEDANRPLQDFITRKEGITLVSRLATQQLGDFVFRLNEIENSSGAANQAFEDVTQGVARWNFEIRQARERLNGFLSEIGENFLPILARMLTVIADIVGGFAELPTWVQQGTLALTGFAAVLSIILQVAGAIKGLKIVAVFGGIGKAASAAGLGAGILATSLGGIAIAATAVVGLSIALGAGMVRAQREAAEAAEENRRAMEGIRDLQQDIIRGSQRSQTVVNGSILAQRQQMRELGGISNYDVTPEGEVEYAGLFGTSFIAMQSEEWVEENLERLQNNLETLRSGTLTTLEAEATRLRTTIGRGLDNFMDILGREARTRRMSQLEVLQEVLLPNADPALFTGELSENLDEIERAIQAEIGRIENSVLQGGPQVQQRLSLLQSLASSLSAYVGSERDLTYLEGDLARVRETESGLAAAVIELQRLVNQPVETPDEPLWRKLFEEITGVTLAGRAASVAYDEFITTIRDRTRALTEALGGQVDEVDLYIASLDKRFSDLQALLVEHGDVFTLDWALISGEPGGRTEAGAVLGPEFVSLIGQLNRDIDSAVSGITSSVEELRWGFFDMNHQLEGGNLNIKEATDFLDELNTELDQAKALQGVLAEVGRVDPVLETDIRRLTTYITGLEQIIESLGATVEEVFDFEYAMGRMQDFGTVMRTGLFDLWKELSNFDERSAGASEDFIDNLLSRGVAFATVMGGVLEAAGEALSDTMFALGMAFASMDTFADTFGTAMADILASLAETIPALFIQAGLMVLATNMPLGLTLIGIGLAGQIGAGWVRGMEQRGEEEASGATQLNARGGIINTPTLFSSGGDRQLAGEAGWEGILPLARNAEGELGVKASGGGGGDVYINVQNFTDSEVDVQESNDGSGQIDIIVRRTVKGLVSAGDLDKEMRMRYGIRAARG